METNLKNNIKINTKSFSNYKSLVFSLLIYVIAGLVVFFGGLPLYTSFTVKSTEIDAKKAEISALDKKIAQLEKAKDLKVGKSFALCVEGEEDVYAVLHLDEIFNYDLDKIATEVFHTTEEAHPGVRKLMHNGNCFLGGKISFFFKIF